MAEVQDRHRKAAAAWWLSLDDLADIPDTQGAYAQALADREAEAEGDTIESLRVERDFLRTYLVNLKKLCPCGGIILADTEDFDVPLCDDCWQRNEQDGLKNG